MNKELFEELKKQLNESMEEPYNRQDDKTVMKLGQRRRPVLTLDKLNKIKKMRNAKREEIAQHSVFIPYLYGPAEEQPNEMGGGLGL